MTGSRDGTPSHRWPDGDSAPDRPHAGGLIGLTT